MPRTPRLRLRDPVPDATGASTGFRIASIVARRGAAAMDLCRRRRRGQSLAEFAIVFPVLMLVIGGIIQFGIIFWGQNTLNQLVRDAGRYAVTVSDCSSASQADIVAKIDAVAANTNFAGRITGRSVVLPTTTAPDPVSDPCPATSNARQVWLRITVQAQVPTFFPLLPGNGNLSSSAVFRMEPVTAP